MKEIVSIYFHIMYVWLCCKGSEVIYQLVTPGCNLIESLWYVFMWKSSARIIVTVSDK